LGIGSNDPNSWNGFDANGGVIKGTPKQENSNNSMIDTIAPDSPSLEILQCDNSMSENSCLIATTTLDIIWATTTPCVDFSHFNIDDNGTFSTTMATTTQIINLNDGEIGKRFVDVWRENFNSQRITLANGLG